jgi:hypothetical protein
MSKLIRNLKARLGKAKAGGKESISEGAKTTLPFNAIPPHTCEFCKKLVFEAEEHPYRSIERRYTQPYDENQKDIFEVTSNISPGVTRWREMVKEAKFRGPVQLVLQSMDILWDFTLMDVKQAAAEGCYLCQFLRDRFSRDMDKVDFPLLAATTTGFTLEFGIPAFSRVESYDLEIGLRRVKIDTEAFRHMFTVVAPKGERLGTASDPRDSC